MQNRLYEYSKGENEWIAVCKNKVLAHGKDFGKVMIAGRI
ncbi:MAG: DUF5678 domain-containing protein [Methanosarcinales archaeon]